MPLPPSTILSFFPQLVTLGASVTRGIGTTDRQYAYANRFFEYINATWPHR
jgi:hypothetical protein